MRIKRMQNKIRNLSENYENHVNLRNQRTTQKIMNIIEINVKIKKTMNILQIHVRIM